MPSTLNRDYPYPTSASPNNVPYDVQQLAEAVDVDMAARAAPFRLAIGVGSIDMTGTIGGFTFDLPAGRFTAPPIVFVFPRVKDIGTYINTTVVDLDTVSCIYYSGGVQPLPYAYIAVQMTPASAAG